jgi:hypothetical protein
VAAAYLPTLAGAASAQVRRLLDAFHEPFRKPPKSAAAAVAAAGAARGGGSQQQAPGGSQPGPGSSGALGSQGGALGLAPAPGEISEIIGRADDEDAPDAGEDDVYESGDFEEDE